MYSKALLNLSQERSGMTSMQETHQMMMRDETVIQLLSSGKEDANQVAANFMAALDYVVESLKVKNERQANPIDHVVIRLDASDCKEAIRMYPESRYRTFLSCDMEHLFDCIKSSDINFGHTKMFIANMKVNPKVPFMVKEIDYLEKIMHLFCGETDYQVKWGLVKTNSVVRVGIGILYQE